MRDELTYEGMISRIKNEKPFAFIRLGDGDFDTMIGHININCDGHKYYPIMSQRLREILMFHAPYHIGLQKMAMEMPRIREWWDKFKIQFSLEGLNYCEADMLHNASIDNRLGELIGTINDSKLDKIVVGPYYVRSMRYPVLFGRQIPVPRYNCWLMYEHIKKQLYDTISVMGQPAIILYTASSTAKILIDDMESMLPGCHIHIDVGSVFDPYVGINSRRYHPKISERLNNAQNK